jgi:hypothetical protein|tara:strand:+ start:131 stop:502 length:372 start_codon:yes stop_codon:yes gene_type:complete
MIIWGEKQDAAIQRIHDQLLESLQICNDVEECKFILMGQGWPTALDASGDPIKAVKATIGFFVIQKRRKELMSKLKEEHDKQATKPGEHQQGIQADKAARKLGMPSRNTKSGPESLSSIMKKQ